MSAAANLHRLDIAAEIVRRHLRTGRLSAADVRYAADTLDLAALAVERLVHFLGPLAESTTTTTITEEVTR